MGGALTTRPTWRVPPAARRRRTPRRAPGDEHVERRGIARFAGHDPSVTLRTYAHVSHDDARAAAAALGALYGTRS